MSNVKLTHVASLDDVAQCNENQIVFVAETGEIYTHSTRYGSPVMLNIGEDESAADITMQPAPASNSVQSRSARASVSSASNLAASIPSALSMDNPVVKTVEVNIQPGYIRMKNGSVLSPNEFSGSKKGVEGVYASPNLLVDLSDLGIYEWGLMNVGVKSTKTNSLNEAMRDMDGEYNTKLLKDLGSEVFDSCSDGWYIPSLGELSLIADSYSVICSSLSLISGAIPLINSFYWSSTSGEGNKSAWALNMSGGKGQLGYRTSKLAIRRVKKI